MLTGFCVSMASPYQFIEVILSRFSLASASSSHVDLKQLANWCTQLAIQCAFCGPFRAHNRPSAVSRGSICWLLLKAGVLQPGDTMNGSGEVGQLNRTAVAAALSFACGRSIEESILRDTAIVRECLELARQEALTRSTA